MPKINTRSKKAKTKPKPARKVQKPVQVKQKKQPTSPSPLPRTKDEWEAIYTKRETASLPWNIDAPAKELSQFLETGAVLRGRALDIGCGTGTNSVSLTRKGFQVIGIDRSPTAIALAKDNAKRARVHCTFWVGDALNLNFPNGYFDFIFDRGCFQSLQNRERKKFVSNIARVVAPGGWYQLVCVDDGKTNKEVLQSVFAPEFEVRDLVKTQDRAKDKRPVQFVVAVLERSESV